MINLLDVLYQERTLCVVSCLCSLPSCGTVSGPDEFKALYF